MSNVFNFVIDCSDSELSQYLNMKPKDAYKAYIRGDTAWCLQAHNNLANRKNIITQCSNQLNDEAINIIHSDQLLKLKGSKSSFIVCARADYPDRGWAHYRLVQNKTQVDTNASYIPHWIQEGLVERSLNRQGVSRVAYAGQDFNGNLAESADAWKALLQPLGVEFVILSSELWHDLSAVDVLIGIRSFDSRTYNTKPPTKLFNAWHANIPFIGGQDSAFTQVGIPGEDYLVAKTSAEATNFIIQLKEDADMYSKLVQNGKRKTIYYNKQTITDIWEETLLGPITDRFKQWQSRRSYETARFQVMQGIGLLEHQTKQTIKKLISF